MTKTQELLVLSSRCSQHSAHGVQVGYQCTTVGKLSLYTPHHLWHCYPLLLCLITVGTEEDSLVYAFLASLIYSFYNYFLCPGIVTDAEHTQIRHT